MQIVISTIEGTFVVPKQREADLIYWLKHNATKIDGGNGSSIKEQQYNHVGTQLLNENGDLVGFVN